MNRPSGVMAMASGNADSVMDRPTFPVAVRIGVSRACLLVELSTNSVLLSGVKAMSSIPYGCWANLIGAPTRSPMVRMGSSPSQEPDRARSSANTVAPIRRDGDGVEDVTLLARRGHRRSRGRRSPP